MFRNDDSQLITQNADDINEYQTIIRVLKAEQVLTEKIKKAPLYMEVLHYRKRKDKPKEKIKLEPIPLPFLEKKADGKNRFNMGGISALSKSRAFDLAHSAVVMSGQGKLSGERVSVDVHTDIGKVHFDLTPKGDVYLMRKPEKLDLKIETCGRVIDTANETSELKQDQREKTHPFVKVRLVRATNESAKKSGVNSEKLPFYVEVIQGNQKEGVIGEPQIIALPFLPNQINGEDRFNINAIAAKAPRNNIEARALSGKGLGEGKRTSFIVPNVAVGELLMEITSNGDIELVRIPKDMEFKLEVPGTVSTRADINTNLVQIKCKKFINEHNLAANKIQLECTEVIRNKGLLFAEESIDLNCKEVVNTADAALASKGTMSIQTATIKNKGYIGATGKLETTSPCLLKNGSTGIIMSESDLSLQLAPDSENSGNISSNDQGAITGTDFLNAYSGKISATNQLNMTFQHLKNDGGIGADGEKAKIEIKAEQFDNNIDGSVQSARDLKINTHDLNNSGELLTRFELNCKTKNLTTERCSLMLSGNRAYLTCTERSVMHGVVGSKVWTTLKAPRSEIAADAQFGGNGYVTLDVAEELQSLGKIRGGRYVSLKSKKLNLTPESIVQSDLDLQMDSTQIDSAGSLYAPRDALYSAEENFVHHADAYSKAKNTRINAKQATNAGVIEGNLTLKANHFENLLTGSLSANEFIKLHSDVFKNSGVVKSLNDIYAETKTIIDNAATGKISATMSVQLLCQSLVKNSGKVDCLGPIKIEAENILQDMAESKLMSLKRLSCLAKLSIKNAGTLGASEIELKTTTDDLDGLIQNLENAKIISQGQVDVNTEAFSNAGLVAGDLKVDANSFENLLTGKIAANEFLNINADVFINENVIESFKTINLGIKNILQNKATGSISANESLKLICQTVIKNSGKIDCLGPIKVDAEGFLQDLVQSKTISQKHLSCIVKLAILNSGTLGGDTLELKTTTENLDGLIHNLVDAKIVSQGNADILSDIIKNAGQIQTQTTAAQEQKLTLKAKVHLENLASGLISAADGLSVEGEAGANNGEIFAKWASLDFKKDFTTTGLIQTEQNLSIHAVGTLNLLKDSKINAKAALTLLGDQAVYSEADILAYQTLTITTKLMAHAAGNIESKQDILLTTIDWMLAGKVKAAHDFVAKVASSWNWKPSGDFQGENKSAIHLSGSRDFTRPKENHPGSLEFHAPLTATLRNLTSMSSKKNLILSGGNVINGNENTEAKLRADEKFESRGKRFDNVNGGVFGAKGVEVDADDGIHNGRSVQTTHVSERTVFIPYAPVHKKRGEGYQSSCRHELQTSNWFTSNKSYIASTGPMILKSRGGMLNELAEIFTTDSLLTVFGGIFENRSGAIFANSANISASLYRHYMMVDAYFASWHHQHLYALSNKAYFTVNTNCVFNAPIVARGGNIQVGQTLSYLHSLDAQRVVEFDNYKHLYIWSERPHRRRGGRYTYSRYDDDRKDHDVYESHVGAKVIECPNSQSSLQLGSVVNADHLNLKFAEMHVGNTDDLRQFRGVAKFEYDLMSYFTETSRLFRKKGDASSAAIISPEVPLPQLNVALPAKVFVGQRSDIDYFDERIEILLVQKAMSDSLGRITLDDAANTPATMLAKLRQNALDYANSLGVAILTEELLRAATKPMLIYRAEVRDGQSVAVSSLIMPTASQKLKPGVYAKSADLEGAQLHITGKMEVEKRLNMNVKQFKLEQRTVEDYVHVHYGKKHHRKEAFVKEVSGLDDTGVLHAGEVKGTIGNYQQTGGLFSTDVGGADLKIKHGATFNSLRTTEVIRSNIDYSIMPLFTPAYMVSEGDQSIVVTAGGMRIKGLVSHAAGNNTLSARDKIDVSQASEEYKIPTTRSGRSRKRVVTGGTETSHTGNEFISGGNLKITSSQDDVALSNVILGSVKNTELSGRNVSILPGESIENHWRHSKTLKGFQFQKANAKQREKSALLSSLMVGEDLIINAVEKIKMSGIQGLVGGNFYARASEIDIDGAKEESSNEIETKSLSVSFFGSKAIESVCAGESGRKAVDHLLREDSFINAVKDLAKSRDAGSLSVNTFQTFIEGWRLAAMVGQSCGENGFDKDKFLGSMTDRWGLTTSDEKGENRKFNPKFTFRYGKSFYQDKSTRTISSSLRVLGNIELVGDIVRLNDGTKLSARGIRIMARQLLEMNRAQNTFQSKSNSQGISAGVTVCDPALVSVGHDGSNGHSSSKTHSNAQLNADTVELVSDEKIAMTGASVEAADITMRAPKIEHTSVQDTKDESNLSYNVNVNLATPGVSGSFNHGSHHSKQTVQSVAHASRSFTIETNEAKITGTAWHSDNINMSRHDHKNEPVNIIKENLHNSSVTKNTSVSFNISPASSMPFTGTFEQHKEVKEGITYASIGSQVPGSVETKNKKSNLGFGVAIPNGEKISKEWEDIKNGAQTVANEIKSLLSKKEEKPSSPDGDIDSSVSSEDVNENHTNEADTQPAHLEFQPTTNTFEDMFNPSHTDSIPEAPTIETVFTPDDVEDVLFDGQTKGTTRIYDDSLSIVESFDYRSKVPGQSNHSYGDNEFYRAVGRGVVSGFKGLWHMVTHADEVFMDQMQFVTDGLMMHYANEERAYGINRSKHPFHAELYNSAEQRMNQRVLNSVAATDAFINAPGLKKVEIITAAATTIWAPGRLFGGFKMALPNVLRETALFEKIGLGADWDYFYRGDSTYRTEFLSKMSLQYGSEYTTALLNRKSPSEILKLCKEHGYDSTGSPFISVTSNPVVTEFYAKGRTRSHGGFITTFRMNSKTSKKMIREGGLIPNYESPVGFGEPHPVIGVPEYEYLFIDKIDPKFIYKSVKKKEFSSYGLVNSFEQCGKFKLNPVTTAIGLAGLSTLSFDANHQADRYLHNTSKNEDAIPGITNFTNQVTNKSQINFYGAKSGSPFFFCKKAATRITPKFIDVITNGALDVLEKIFLPAAANASESYPTCNRPDYASALAAFRQVDGYGNSKEIADIIGGKVKENIDADIFHNACAIRGSRLFNAPDMRSKVNCTIPRIKGETVTGGDGLQYIYRVSTLINHLTKVWGPPDYDSRKKNQHLPPDTHGVVIKLMPESAMFGYTGHFEVSTFVREDDVLYWHLPNTPELKDSPQLKR